MNQTMVSILGIPGSLRRASYNRGLLRAAKQVAPADVQIDIVDLGQIPLYNADVEATGDPEPVRQFKEQIRAADALLIATPEYNYSIPGVLKNAIDWASRPPSESVLRHKPVAVMGASTGLYGTVRSQLTLRQVLFYTESPVLLRPEVYVSNARDLFDADGTLLDDKTKERVHRLIVALVDWTHRLRVSNL